MFLIQAIWLKSFILRKGKASIPGLGNWVIRQLDRKVRPNSALSISDELLEVPDEQMNLELYAQSKPQNMSSAACRLPVVPTARSLLEAETKSVVVVAVEVEGRGQAGVVADDFGIVGGVQALLGGVKVVADIVADGAAAI